MDKYEKLYNEALERARADYNNHLEEGYKNYREHLETIFPELAESEDERIINQLITLVNSTGEVLLIPTNKEELIAYLEKQKEQKPEERFEEARGKYQVEWSEEDESKMGVIIRLVEQNSGWPYRAIKEYVNWLKSLRPVKQELSEDVKKTLDEVSHILVGLNYKQIAKDYKQAIEKLLSLRPSWKPSEEQMEALEYVIRDYREDSCNATANYLQEILDHLKNM